MLNDAAVKLERSKLHVFNDNGFHIVQLLEVQEEALIREVSTMPVTDRALHRFNMTRIYA